MQKVIAAILVSLTLVTLSTIVPSVPAIGGPVGSWARIFGTRDDIVATSVRQTMEGGFIVAGSRTVQTPIGTGFRTVLLRMDKTGALVWLKAYGCSCAPVVGISPKVAQTRDRGFAVESTVNVSSTTFAASVFKVDSDGSLVWQEAFPGLKNSIGGSIDVTSDGGIVLAAKTEGLSTERALVVKLDGSGGVLWQKTYGTPGGFTTGDSIRSTSDGGFIVSGGTYTVGGPSGLWLLRLDSSGNILWQKKYSTPAFYTPASVQQTSDGGFIAATKGNVLRLDQSGVPIWQKSYQMLISSLDQSSDEGIVITGVTSLSVPPANALVLQLDSSGSVLWQRAFSPISLGLSVQQTSDKGFIIAGLIKTTPTSYLEMLVFKLDRRGEIASCPELSTSNLLASDAPVTESSPEVAAVPLGGLSVTTTFSSSAVADASATVLCQFAPHPSH